MLKVENVIKVSKSKRVKMFQLSLAPKVLLSVAFLHFLPGD